MIPQFVNYSYGYRRIPKTIEHLHDVSFSSTPTEGQALLYDSSNNVWRPRTVVEEVVEVGLGVSHPDRFTIDNSGSAGVMFYYAEGGYYKDNTSSGTYPFVDPSGTAASF